MVFNERYQQQLNGRRGTAGQSIVPVFFLHAGDFTLATLHDVFGERVPVIVGSAFQQINSMLSHMPSQPSIPQSSGHAVPFLLVLSSGAYDNLQTVEPDPLTEFTVHRVGSDTQLSDAMEGPKMFILTFKTGAALETEGE